MARLAKFTTTLVGSLLLPSALIAQAADTPSDPESDAYKKAKALAELQEAAAKAQTAAANAETARIAAEVAAAKAGVSGGMEAPTPPTTAPTAAAGTGKAEAALLYASALRTVSTRLNASICPGKPATGTPEPFYLATSASPTFKLGDLATYRVGRFTAISELDHSEAAVLDAMARAAKITDDTDENENGLMALGAGLAAANSLVGALAKIGSNFKSVYAFGGVEVATNNTMLADLIACEHAQIVRPEAIPLVDFELFTAQDDGGAQVSLIPVVARIDRLRATTLEAAAKADTYADSESKEGKAARAILQAAVSLGNSTIGKAQTFLDSLTATSATAPTPKIVTIAEQLKLKSILSTYNTRLLILNQTPIGGYYTKDNLWTFLGGPPLYVMGGVTLSYSLVDPATGVADRSGVFVEHAGYQSMSKVARAIRKANGEK